MLQYVEQGCEPRDVLRRLGRNIAHAAECASRTEFALDLIVNAYRACRIGELLTEVKATVGHGNFLPWIKEHCEFSQTCLHGG